MTARQEKEEEVFVNAGRGEQPALWAVQHSDVGVKRDPVFPTGVWARWVAGFCRQGGHGCEVVVSCDGGRSWRPAGEDKP